MKTPDLKGILCLAAGLLLLLPLAARAQDPGAIKLDPPNLKAGPPLMEALSLRASARAWSDKDLSKQDLSNLLWAANGINRPDSGKRTAASAKNSQDVDIYVLMKDGAYLYDAKQHALVPVVSGDLRSKVLMSRPPMPPGGKPGDKPSGPPPGMPAGPPPDRPKGTPTGVMPPGGPGPQSEPAVLLLLVSDISRFHTDKQDLALEWAALDVGLVSQNISLYCSSFGLATRPRASTDRARARELLKLKDTQFPLLNHPVGYALK